MKASASREDTKQPSLSALVDLCADQMSAVNSTIIDRLQSDVPLIPELGGHLIAAGGKRMRPLLTLAGAQVAGADSHGTAKAIKLATAVEFIHSATLLHDDVIDQSSLRRGRDTANALWGNEASVLVGDFLFARSFELMVETGNINVLGRLAAAAAAEIGGGNAADIAVMHDYGMKLGLAFQIMDDALDYAADAGDMGKNVGDDFADQKITMPTIIAWQKGDEQERAFWRRTLGNADFADGDLAKAQDLLTKHKAIEASLDAARANAVEASDAIITHCCARGDQASNIIGQALGEAALFAAARNH